MPVSEERKRPDSNTVFVSLGLALLVLFTYLTATAFPSKKLCRQAIPQENEKPPETRVLIAKDLEKLVRVALRHDHTHRYEPAESVLLLDGRLLSRPSPTGRSYREELHRWLAETSSKRTAVSVTCFLPEIGVLTGSYIEQLQTRRTECAALIGSGNDPSSRPVNVYSRILPVELRDMLISRSLPAAETILLTVTNHDRL